MPLPEFISPNLYQLSGKGIHVAYLENGARSRFSYQDSQLHLTFNGDQISRLESELGSTVSVVLRNIPDAGSTTFSLLIPRINLKVNETLAIKTYGITTVHRSSFAPVLDHGQLDQYSVTRLKGSAVNAEQRKD